MSGKRDDNLRIHAAFNREKRMKQFKLATSAAFGAALLATGAAQAGGVTDKEVLIGHIGTLSGPVALWGTPTAEAIRMRFEEANNAGGVHGRMIKVIVEDNQYQVPRAIQAANKLMNKDKVFAMIANLGTPMNNAVLPKQLKNNIPNLFPFSGGRQMSEPFHKLKFQALSTYYDQIRGGIKYLVEEKGVKVVCDIYQDTDYGREIHLAAEDQLKAMGLKLGTSTAHKPTATDFAAAVAKLKKGKCEAIMMGTIIRDTILPVATAKKIGWNPIWLGPVAMMDTLVAAAKGGVTEGLYAMTSFEYAYPDDPRPKVQKFIQDFTKRTGKAPNQAAQLGYISADLTVLGLQNAGRDLTVDSLVKGLEMIKDHKDIFDGAAVSFGPKKRIGSRAAFLVQVENGRWVRRSGNISYE
jgi:branched-chain amino acid transport system substrate-binding protein